VDGSTGVVGSYRDDLDGAITKARANPATVADVHVMTKNGKASIDVGAGQGTARILLVGFDREHVTPIGRGENRGCTMAERIVRSFRSVAEWSGVPIHLDVELPEGEQLAIILEALDGNRRCVQSHCGRFFLTELGKRGQWLFTCLLLPTDPPGPHRTWLRHLVGSWRPVDN